MATPKKPKDKLPVKNKVGRKPWIPTPEILKDVETYASRFLKEDQICYLVGISEGWWYEKKKEYPELAEAIKKGRAKVAAVLSNKLYEMAKEGNTAVNIFLAKSVLGLRENDPQIQTNVALQVITTDGRKQTFDV